MDKKLKVLVVDDEKELRGLLQNILLREGYDVNAVGTAEEGFKSLSVDVPDMLLTDLKLPGMNGLQLLEKTKEIYPGLPVIVITGYGTVEDAVTALKMGAENFILKPFNIKEIKNIISKVFELKRNFLENGKIYDYTERTISINMPSKVELIEGAVFEIIKNASAFFSESVILTTGIPLSLTESFANAVIHGNKRDEEKRVKITAQMSKKGISVTVEDEGEGFSLDKVRDPLEKDDLLTTHGRGLFLIKCYADSVEFNEKGNIISMIFKRQGN